MESVSGSPHEEPGRLAGLLFALAVLTGLAFAVDDALLIVTGNGTERRDFVSYWAAGQQLTAHKNPYDAVATLALERPLGFPPESEALIVRNPPILLPLVAPLGYMRFRAAATVWSMALLACWLASLQMLWTIFGGPRRHFCVFGYTASPAMVIVLFAPALACIVYGQTGLFALLGFVLFLRFHEDRPFIAGAALWLCALKPHLLLPFGVVLVLWAISTRRYRVLAGAVVAVGAGVVAVRLLDAMAWQQYFAMLRSAGLAREFIPCVSIALRFALRPGAAWVQYLPAAAGCVWAAVWFLRRGNAWSWMEDGPLLVLVGIVAAPYAWITDQALVAPAMLLLAWRVGFRGLLALAAMSAVVEGGILAGVTMHSAFYLWTAPAWLVWYFAAGRVSAEISVEPISE